MAEMGTAMMGTGEAGGVNRAIEAAQGAIANPLLDITSMKGAKGLLINITGGFDMTLYEVDAAANEIRAEVDPNANIILGSTFDETMEGRIRVSIVATGIDDADIVAQQTVVPPAQKTAPRYDAGPISQGAGVLAPAGRIGLTPADALDDPRPSFAREADDDLRRDAAGGQAGPGGKGFSLFGWMRGGETEGARLADAAPRTETGGERPAGEDDLEIPAFLRRQMTPR
jgi:cell division protein FtsZ